MKQILLGIIALFGLFSSLYAQSIQGQLTELERNTPLPGVNVVLLNTARGTVSATDGSFKLENIPNGNYTLRISHVGYQLIELPVQVPGETQNLQIALEPSIIELNKGIVITSQRRETYPLETPEVTSVLTRDALTQLASRATPEAMMGMTGVWIQKTNHGGGTPFIRGLTGNQTLIMIDGIRLNNSTFRFGPNQYLNTIDPLTLDRIEAVRGSGSVQYGSDALGGVVQLITKDPYFTQQWKASGELYLKYMSADMENTVRGDIQLSNSRFALQGGFTYSDFGDVKGGKGIGKQIPSGYDQLAGDLKAKWQLNSRNLLTFAYQYLKQEDVPLFYRIQLDDFKINQFDPQKRTLSYLRWESFYKNKWFQKVSVTGLYTQSDEGRQSQRNNSTTFIEEEDIVKTGGGILEIYSQPTKIWEFTSGAEYYYDEVSSATTRINLNDNSSAEVRGLYPDGSTYSNLAIFSLHSLDLGKISLKGGLRYNTFVIKVPDENLGESTIKPSALVGNFAIQYAFHPQHRLIAAVNNTFRAPNINDMGTLGIVDFRYEVPAYDLKPEQSLNFDLSYKTNLKNFSANISLYHNELKDLITRVRGSFNGADSINGIAVYVKENVSKAFIQGVEMDFAYSFADHWATYGSLVFTYGENKPTEEPIRRIPPLNGRLGLKYKSDFGFQANLECLYAAKQTRLANGDKSDNRIPAGGTPGFQVFNLYLGYQYKWFQVNAGWQNILNEAYRTHGSGIDGYGSSFWLATRFRF